VRQLITPEVFETLTSAASMEHAARGQVCFSVDGHYYAFSMDRRSMERLAQQIQKALARAPISRRQQAGFRSRRAQRPIDERRSR
jgi:hypothetical protein